MAVKLSTFLNTSLVDALDSGGILNLINDSANVTLGTNTIGNYVQSIAGGHGISIINGDAEGASTTVTVDSSVTALLTSTQSFTNKTIDLSNNTINGTTAQFNAALSNGTFSTVAGTETLTNKTITSPNINQPTIVGPASLTKISTFGLRDVNATDFDLRLKSVSTPDLSTDRTLSIDVNNGNRTISIKGTVLFGGAFTTSGSHATTLTTSATTALTLPTSGTLVSKNGSGNVSIGGSMTATSFIGDGSSLTGVSQYGVTEFDSDFGDNTTDNLSEGSTNIYHTTSRARAAVSASDTGGFGSFAYDNSTGVMTYTGPSTANVRGSISGSTGISYNASTGVISADNANINHDALNNFVANEHINHANVSVTAGNGLSGGGTIAATRTITVGQGTGITVSTNAIATNDAEIVHDDLSGFVANEHINHANVSVTAGNGLTGGGTIAATRTINVVAGTGTGINANANNIELDSAELTSYYGAAILAAVKANDGAGSGLDADLLDGQTGSSYLRSNANGTLTGSLVIGNGAANDTLEIKKADNNVADHVKFFSGTTRMGEIGTQDNTWLRINQVTNKNIYTPRFLVADNGLYVIADATLGITATGVGKFATGTTINGQTAWHAGNDGAASGLDADLLDGQHGSYYRINVYNSSGTLLN